MTREAVEVASEGLHVDSQMRHRLGTVDEDRHAVGVGYAHKVGDRIDSAEGIGDVVDCHDAGAGREETFVGLEVEYALVAERYGTQGGAGQLPGHDVAVVLHARHDHLVVAGEVAPRKRRRHEVDALGGATGEDNLAAMAGTDEGLHLAADVLVALGGLDGQVVGATVYVGVDGAVVVAQGVDHGEGFLGGGCVVEVDKRVAVHLLVEYGEL